jgi:hypothetical protein
MAFSRHLPLQAHPLLAVRRDDLLEVRVGAFQQLGDDQQVVELEGGLVLGHVNLDRPLSPSVLQQLVDRLAGTTHSPSVSFSISTSCSNMGHAAAIRGHHGQLAAAEAQQHAVEDVAALVDEAAKCVQASMRRKVSCSSTYWRPPWKLDRGGNSSSEMPMILNTDARADGGHILVVHIDLNLAAGSSRKMLNRRRAGRVVPPARVTLASTLVRTLTSRSVAASTRPVLVRLHEHVVEDGQRGPAADDRLHLLQPFKHHVLVHDQLHACVLPAVTDICIKRIFKVMT